MIVRTRLVKLFGAGGITVFPFVFLHPWAGEKTEAHERIHYRQQKRWFVFGLGVGLLVWFLLYLLCLPVGWNPLRFRAEMEAYTKGSGFRPTYARAVLHKRPYWLWWH